MTTIERHEIASFPFVVSELFVNEDGAGVGLRSISGGTELPRTVGWFNITGDCGGTLRIGERVKLVLVVETEVVK